MKKDDDDDEYKNMDADDFAAHCENALLFLEECCYLDPWLIKKLPGNVRDEIFERVANGMCSLLRGIAHGKNKAND